MRNFDICSEENYTDYNSKILQPILGEPCYNKPWYEDILVQDIDGSKLHADITEILLHQEKYRRELGNSVVDELIRNTQQMSDTPEDKMSDNEILDNIVSRHCQSMSERADILQYLAENYSGMKERVKEYMENMKNNTNPAAPDTPSPAE